MAEFVIKKRKLVEIKNEDGEVLASYDLNIGNHESMKMWMRKIESIEALSKRIGQDEKALDDLLEMEKEIITMITGDWNNLWKICEENLFTMLQIVRFFSDHVKDEIESVTSKYL